MQSKLKRKGEGTLHDESDIDSLDGNNLNSTERKPLKKKNKGGRRRPKTEAEKVSGLSPYILKRYGSLEAYNEHLNSKKSITATPRKKLCSHCGEEFSVTNKKSEGPYRRHMAAHFIEKFTCECEPTWKNDKEKNYHIKCIHSGHFGCKICLRTFAKEEKFKTHTEHHHSGAKLFICDLCGFEAKLKGNLKTHIQLRHDKEIQTCSICGAQFEGMKRLKVHIKRTHCEEKPCPYCGGFYKFLTKHLKTHRKKLLQ